MKFLLIVFLEKRKIEYRQARVFIRNHFGFRIIWYSNGKLDFGPKRYDTCLDRKRHRWKKWRVEMRKREIIEVGEWETNGPLNS